MPPHLCNHISLFVLIPEQTSDMCFPTVATPVSSCQYTMVPLQGLALVGHCPLDAHMTAPHGVYPPNGEYIPNGKPHHPTHCLPGLQQVKHSSYRLTLLV